MAIIEEPAPSRAPRVSPDAQDAPGAATDEPEEDSPAPGALVSEIAALTGTSDLVLAVAPDGRIRAASSHAPTLTGLTPTELEGLELTSLVGPDDRARLERLVSSDRHLASHLSHVHHRNGTVTQVEFWFQWRQDPRDDWVVVVRDLTPVMGIVYELHHRRDFDTLLTDVAAMLLELAPGEFDHGVTRALGVFAQACDAERAWLFTLTDATLSCANEWQADGAGLPPLDFERVDRQNFAWWAEQTENQPDGVIKVQDTHALPPEAAFLEEPDSRRAFLSAPIEVRGKRIGFLGIDAPPRTQPWPEHVTGTIQAVAHIVGHALAANRARLELAASEADFREAVDCLLDPVTFLDPVRDEDGTIIDFEFAFANAAALRDYSELHDDNRRLSARYPHLTSALIAECVEVMATGVPKVIRHHDDESGQEPRAFTLQTIPFHHGVMLNLRDETEPMLAERARLEEANRYRQLIDISPDAIVVHDGNHVVFANQAAANLVGLEKFEPDANLVQFLHPDSVTDTFDRIASLRAEGDRTAPAVVTIVSVTGECRIVEAISVKTLWQGQPAYQVIMRDQTERLRAAHELERRAEFEGLLVEISQELTGETGDALIDRIESVLARVAEYIGASHVCLRIAHGDMYRAWDYPDLIPDLIPDLSASDLAGPSRSLTAGEVSRILHTPLQAGFVLPLEQSDELIGVLAFGSKSPFARTDLSRLAPFAALLAATLARDEAIHQVTESEARLRGVLEHLPVWLSVLDPDGKVLLVDGSAMRSLPVRPDDVVGRVVVQENTPYPEMIAGFEQARQGSEGSCQVSIASRRFDVRFTPLHAGTADTEIDGVLVVGHDITDRWRAETALRESEEMFRTAFSSSPLGICLFDADGNFKAANQAMCAIMGLRESEIADSYESFISDPDDYAVAMEAVRAAIAEPGTVSVYVGHLHGPDGQMRSLESYLTALQDQDGRLAGFIAQARDITDSERAQVEISTLNQELAGQLAELDATQHELRVVLADLDQAREQERRRVAMVLHDDTVQALVGTRVLVEQLPSLVSDPAELQVVANHARVALDVALTSLRRMIADLWPPVLAQTGLGAAVTDTLNDAAKDGIHTELHDKLPYRLDAELEALSFRTIQEGVRNIVQHASAAEITVTLRIDTTTSSDLMLAVTVDDDGVGFSESELGRRASRGHIGVASMRETILAAGGTFDLLRRHGGGTRLAFHLPLDKALRRTPFSGLGLTSAD